MKKGRALAAASALLLSISACGVDVGTVSGSDGTTSDAILSSVPGEESQTGEESQAPAKDPEEIEAEVDDNLTGLCSFLAQSCGVGGDPVDMAADFSGAVAGVQYRVSYDGSNNVTVELYEYDLDNLNGEAQAVLDSVKANGTFTVIGQEVTDAYLCLLYTSVGPFGVVKRRVDCAAEIRGGVVRDLLALELPLAVEVDRLPGGFRRFIRFPDSRPGSQDGLAVDGARLRQCAAVQRKHAQQERKRQHAGQDSSKPFH